MVIKNKFSKRCECCGEQVGVGDGFAFVKNGTWHTVCKSTACHRKLGVSMDQNRDNVRKLTEDGKVIMGYDKNAITLLRSMPGARWNPDEKHWTVSVKTEDLDRVIEIADQLKLDVPDSLRNRASVGTVFSQEAEKRAERVRVDGSPLYDFQKDGVRFLALHNHALLADDMGLGKTVEALVAIPENSRVMVTCPSAVKYNWRDEIQLWRPDYSIRIIKGKKDDNIVPAEGEIVIVNYDILPKWLMPSIDSGKINRKGDPILVADIPSDKRSGLSETIVIFDEGHLAKNYKAQRTQKVTQLSKNVAKVWVLTGTPLMNRPFDLWGVLCAFGMYPLGGFSKFVNLFNGSCSKYGGYEFGLPTQEVVERMKRVMIRRLKKDVLRDLPPKTYQRIEVDCSSRSLNKELKELAQEIADAQGINFDADDFSMLDLDTLPDFNAFSRVRALLAKSKIPAMLNLVEEHEETDTPVVIFSAHRAPIDELANRDGWDVITGDTSSEDRQDVVRRFQAGELKGVGLTIKAGGIGHTLTRASNAIFVDLDWTPSWNIQAEDRICRIGQKSNNVTIKRLVSSHPLDIHIQNIIEYKVKLAYMALDNDYVFKGGQKVSSKKSDFVDLKEESDEELSERIRKAEYEANREYYSQKIRRVAERESERVSHVSEPELTEERKSLLRGALGYLCSVCDGAFVKDGMGFNKPDACIGHWMNSIDMETAEDDIYRVLERILVRYRKTQLAGKFDGIWS
jgi:SWI/SNF-related matrix-associated actin-dependent regulator of chromatin subfamily A-like protein 1